MGRLVYANEGQYPFVFNYSGTMPFVPEEVDIISIDVYGYGGGGNMTKGQGGGTEAAYVQRWVEMNLYHSGQ